eukprot:10322378-Karenia_brevis.AAC.1
MLRNVLDIDFAAHRISLQSTTGAIILFDFRAAFPSLSHEFLWDALLGFGLPEAYVNMLKLFYVDNEHKIKIGGQFFDSICVRSGVRQGCPLSPLLFAICSDTLLRRVEQVMTEDDALCAFADDTAAAISDYRASLPILCKIFNEFETVSALTLNVDKTIFIPLWP